MSSLQKALLDALMKEHQISPRTGIFEKMILRLSGIKEDNLIVYFHVLPNNKIVFSFSDQFSQEAAFSEHNINKLLVFFRSHGGTQVSYRKKIGYMPIGRFINHEMTMSCDAVYKNILPLFLSKLEEIAKTNPSLIKDYQRETRHMANAWSRLPTSNMTSASLVIPGLAQKYYFKLQDDYSNGVDEKFNDALSRLKDIFLLISMKVNPHKPIQALETFLNESKRLNKTMPEFLCKEIMKFLSEKYALYYEVEEKPSFASFSSRNLSLFSAKQPVRELVKKMDAYISEANAPKTSATLDQTSYSRKKVGALIASFENKGETQEAITCKH